MKLFIIILSLLICYTAFFMLGFRAWKKGANNLIHKQGELASLLLLNTKHCASMLILAIPFLLFYNSNSFFIAWPSNISYSGIILLMAFIFLLAIIACKSSKSASVQLTAFSIPAISTSISSIVAFFLIRICFLVVYECYFRGIVLATTLQIAPVGWAIIINLVLYVAVHVFSNKIEILACIPFGLLACCFTINWQSVVPAILLHTIFAIVYEGCLLQKAIIFSPKIL